MGTGLTECDLRTYTAVRGLDQTDTHRWYLSFKLQLMDAY